MRIALCDDEKKQREQYGAMLEKFIKDVDVPIALDYYDSGEQLLFHMEDVKRVPDILFLDVNMPGLKGIDVAHKLRERAYSGIIIFLTVSTDHAIAAYDINAFHYIVKNRTPAQKVREIMLRALHMAEEQQTEYLLLSGIGEYRNVPIQRIEYFEVMQRLVTVFYDNDQSFEFVSTIGKIEVKLYGKGFIRISRSFLVSKEHIVSFSYEKVTMRNGAELPVGRKYYKQLKEAMVGLEEG